jgi:hypothetical protein
MPSIAGAKIKLRVINLSHIFYLCKIDNLIFGNFCYIFLLYYNLNLFEAAVHSTLLFSVLQYLDQHNILETNYMQFWVYAHLCCCMPLFFQERLWHKRKSEVKERYSSKNMKQC